jgi:hypothetical protein
VRGKKPSPGWEWVCIFTCQFWILLAFGELASSYPHPWWRGVYVQAVSLKERERERERIKRDKCNKSVPFQWSAADSGQSNSALPPPHTDSRARSRPEIPPRPARDHRMMTNSHRACSHQYMCSKLAPACVSLRSGSWEGTWLNRCFWLAGSL